MLTVEEIKRVCEYCENGQSNIKIQEAYGNNKQVNNDIDLYLDGFPEDPILSIDYHTEEASGYYIDIVYCPFCGRNLKEQA